MEYCYDVVQNKDSDGGDIFHRPGLSLEEQKKLCGETAECKGFNTWGWFKHTINPPDKLVPLGTDPNQQLYIKKDCPTPPKVLVPDEDEEKPMNMYTIIGIIVAIILLVVFPAGYFMFFSGGEEAPTRLKTNL